MRLDPTSPPESVEFNGVTYRLMGAKRRYYLSQSKSNQGRKGAKGLHVAIWEFCSGQAVPKGWVVHHKDGDTFNNDFSNLECLSREQHHKLHPLKNPEKQSQHLQKIRGLATEWHKSPEGREWHRQHSKAIAEAQKPKEITCVFCGKVFMSKKTDAKYCRAQCGYKHRKAQGLYRVERECIKCGKLFITDLPINPARVTKTCSKSCAMSGKRKPRSVQPGS
ncbi:HNH endonuclease signature motif containing protein [Nostoc sp.]|uniref:HNH endonuclease signature motif containing protein n=1 Tax=Nostoc sp. TaxID=1180 RepID=UPI003FA528B7